jgi:hypothetical protein
MLQGVNRNYKRQTAAAAQSPSTLTTSLLTPAATLSTTGSVFSFSGASKQTDEFFKSIENILNQTLQ